MRRLFVILLLGAASLYAARDWSQYEPIIARAPFGKEPPAPEVPVVQPGGSFARQYRLCMLYQDSQGSLKAGLVRKTDNKSFVLTLGEAAENVSLLAVQIEEGIAFLQKDGFSAQLTLEGLNLPAQSAVASAPAPPAQRGGFAQPQRFVRAGNTGVSEAVRSALKTSAPKRGRIVLAKKQPVGGRAGSSAKPEASTVNAGSANSARDSVKKSVSTPASAKPGFRSNGYVVQRVPKHIEIDI